MDTTPGRTARPPVLPLTIALAVGWVSLTAIVALFRPGEEGTVTIWVFRVSLFLLLPVLAGAVVSPRRATAAECGPGRR